jgi:hypothetical protein
MAKFETFLFKVSGYTDPVQLSLWMENRNVSIALNFIARHMPGLVIEKEIDSGYQGPVYIIADKSDPSRWRTRNVN